MLAIMPKLGIKF